MTTLREIREKNYISRKALAKLAGVAEATIIRMESGKTHTTEEVANKVLAALGEKINQHLTSDNVEGLNIYNPMRDRSYPTKYKSEPEAA